MTRRVIFGTVGWILTAGLCLSAAGNTDFPDCRNHIRGITVRADWSDPTRVTPAPEYAPLFESIHDRMPRAVQRAFCSMKYFILLDGKPWATGFAGPNQDASGQVDGYIIGFRRDVADGTFTFNDLGSWKERMPFGGAEAPADRMPTVRVAPSDSRALMHYILAHEFGHVLDMFNELSSGNDGWSALSWKTHFEPLPQFDFPGRNRLCYYNCGTNVIPVEQVSEVYEGLARSNFLSLYAALNAHEDLAESLGFFLMSENSEARYTVEVPAGNGARVLDPLAKLCGAGFDGKRNWLQSLLRRTDLIYPRLPGSDPTIRMNQILYFSQ